MNKYIAQVVKPDPRRIATSLVRRSRDRAPSLARRRIPPAYWRSTDRLPSSRRKASASSWRGGLERPLRYFLAKAADGPVLIVAERIDEIAAELGRRGWPISFTRHTRGWRRRITSQLLRLIGCPAHPVFVASSIRRAHAAARSRSHRAALYRGRLYFELRVWLAAQPMRRRVVT